MVLFNTVIAHLSYNIRSYKEIEEDWNLPLSPPSFDKAQDRKGKGTEAPS